MNIIAHYSQANKMKSCPTLFPNERSVYFRKQVTFNNIYTFFVSENVESHILFWRLTMRNIPHLCLNIEKKLLTKTSMPICTHIWHMQSINFGKQIILMSLIKLLSNLTNIYCDEGELAVFNRP